jgi:hypothetical protein
LIKWYQDDETKNNERGGSIWHLLGRGEVHTLLWWGDLRDGDHLQGIGVGCRIILVDPKI